MTSALLVTGGFLVALVFVQLLLPKRTGRRYGSKLLRCWGRTIMRLAGAQLEVDHAEEVSANGRYVVYANHDSWLNIPTLFGAMPPVDLRFVMKHTLESAFVIGSYLRRNGHFFLERGNRRKAQQLYAAVTETIANGSVVPVIFPEGTTSPTGRLLKIHTAPFEPAVAAGADVLPVAIFGCSRIMSGESVTPMGRGVVRVIFGQRIPTHGKTRKELATEFESALIGLGVEK